MTNDLPRTAYNTHANASSLSQALGGDINSDFYEGVSSHMVTQNVFHGRPLIIYLQPVLFVRRERVGVRGTQTLSVTTM